MAADLQSGAPGGALAARPKAFGHVDKRFGTPDQAFVLMGLIATGIAILAYVLDPDQASVFWTLFALSSIVFLMPYLPMFPALLVLVLHFHFPAEGSSKGVFWLITAGGAIVSLLIGWWLYRRSSRRSGAGMSSTTSDKQG